MQELSLNVLDIAQNSVKADASLIEITVEEFAVDDTLAITIADNGHGMDGETAEKAADPFYTTRTTRKVGLGLSFFKMAALMTDGSFNITSAPGRGTTVKAVFGLTHIDRMPLGDMCETMTALISCNPRIDFVYTHTVTDAHKKDGDTFVLDTRQFKEILGEVPLDSPEVIAFAKDYISQNDVH
ncbi:MAG: sensor histidine kinase [Acetanaerobacterium sp.]